MIDERDIRTACNLGDLLDQARPGDRSAALSLRLAAKHITQCQATLPPIHVLDAWAVGHGFDPEVALDFENSGLPLLSLEIGWRMAEWASKPTPPCLDDVLEQAYAADESITEALAIAKRTCRKVLNELHLSETPKLGKVLKVGRRRLKLVAIASSGRLEWRDVDRGTRFSSGLTGRLKYRGGDR